MYAGVGGARRVLARSLRLREQDRNVDYSPSDLVNEPSVHEFIEQLRLFMIQPPPVTGDFISYAGDAT